MLYNGQVNHLTWIWLSISLPDDKIKRENISRTGDSCIRGLSRDEIRHLIADWLELTAKDLQPEIQVWFATANLTRYFWSSKKWEAHLQTLIIHHSPDLNVNTFKSKQIVKAHVVPFISIVLVFTAKMRIMPMSQYLKTRLQLHKHFT